MLAEVNEPLGIRWFRLPKFSKLINFAPVKDITMNKDTHKAQQDMTATPVEDDGMNSVDATATTRTPRLLAWLSIVTALLSYLLLLITNGIVAMCVAAVSLVLGFIAAARSRGALRRLAITAIIASAVLLAVVGAFVMVIRFGLN